MRFFNHMIKQVEFGIAFKEAVTLSKSGDKQTAFTKLTLLLEKQPANPYLRHQLLLLGEQLHKPVNLPELGGVQQRPGK